MLDLWFTGAALGCAFIAGVTVGVLIQRLGLTGKG